MEKVEVLQRSSFMPTFSIRVLAPIIARALNELKPIKTPNAIG